MFSKIFILILFIISTSSSPVPNCDNKFVHSRIKQLKEYYFPNKEIEFVNELLKEDNICETKFQIPWTLILEAALPHNVLPEASNKEYSEESTLPRMIRDSQTFKELTSESENKEETPCSAPLNETIDERHWQDLVERGLSLSFGISNPSGITIVLKNVNMPNTNDLVSSVGVMSLGMLRVFKRTLQDTWFQENTPVEVITITENGKDSCVELLFYDKIRSYKFVLKFLFDGGKIYPTIQSINDFTFPPGFQLIDYVVLYASNNMLIEKNEALITLFRGTLYSLARFNSSENVDKSRGLAYVWYESLNKTVV